MRPGGQQPITWLIKPIKQAEKQLRREAVSAGMAEAAFLFLAHLGGAPVDWLALLRQLLRKVSRFIELL